MARKKKKLEEKIGSAGGKPGRQASSSLIVSSISPLQALVTSKACSHAAQCLPWIIETTPCPAKFSPLNSLPRHSDTLQPRRDSFTLAHRNTALPRPLGMWALSATPPPPPPHTGGVKPAAHTPQTWPFDLDQDQWNQIHPLGSAFIGLKCCHRFCSTLLGMIHGTEATVSVFPPQSLGCSTHPPPQMN